MNNKLNIVFFLHSSAGEIYVGLPILWFIKRNMEVNVFFVSKNKNILEHLKISNLYVNIMNEIGSFHFGNKKVFLLLTKLISFKQSTILMSCFSGMRIIDKFFYAMIGKSTILFYPHAYTLLEIEDDDNFHDFYSDRKLLFGEKFGNHSHLLINSSLENRYFEQKGWNLKNVHTIGALGYQKKWQKFFLNPINKKVDIKHLNIFVPLRDRHPLFFIDEHYEYILDSFLDLFKYFPQHNFIIKFHPRQKDIDDYKKQLNKLPNVKISDASPFEILQISDLTISVWSSVIQDSVSVGVPAIEFYRHTKSFPQISIDKNGRPISLFYKYGFCNFIDNIDDLIEYLESITKDKIQDLRISQQYNLNKIFSISENAENNLLNIIKYLGDKTLEYNLDKHYEKRIYLNQIIIKILSAFYKRIRDVFKNKKTH